MVQAFLDKLVAFLDQALDPQPLELLEQLAHTSHTLHPTPENDL